MDQTIEAAVLDNDVMSLERLNAILPKLVPGLTVIWSTSSAGEAMRRCLDQYWQPHILICDVELDGTTCMDVCRQLRLERVVIPVLAMSSYSPRKYLQKLVECGAQGFMVKGNMKQMAAALRCVSSGGTFSPIINVAFPTPQEACRDSHACRASASNEISDIEENILRQTSQGYSTEEIAESLSITSSTVRSHTRYIREKLGAKTLSHAVALWLLRDKHPR